MRLLLDRPRRLLALLAALALFGCGQSSPPPGGHEAATASAALADLPPPSAAAITTAAPSAVAAAPSASAAPTATADARAATKAATPTATATALAEGSPPATATAVAPTAAPSVEPPPIVDVVSPKIAEGTFNTWMQSSGRYTAGQPGSVKVMLVATGGFHCNDKYPYKFKLGAASGGVTYPQPIVRVEAMRVTPERSVMTVPFVPSAAGDARVSGTFSFSVCSATSCQIEARELSITVKVD